MDHVNKTLHLSLKQDIKILTDTIEDIKVDADIKSWMFPTKNSGFVKEFINANKVFEYENTELYLELLVDRLYVGLRSVLIHLESTVNNETVKDNNIIQKPRQITLGCCFLSLWRLVGILINKMADQNNQSITKPRNSVDGRKTKNGKTQTDKIALDKCDSCASAITCMKSLLDIFEESNDVSIKKKIRPQIFNITQFGSMLETAVSVEDSLKTLIGKLVVKSRENEELRTEFDKLAKESKEKERKVKFLEEEMKVYKDQYRKNSLTITSLSKQQEEFVERQSENDRKKESLEGLILKLKESSKIDKLAIKNLKDTNKKMSDYQKNFLQFQKMLVHKLAGLRHNIQKLENEQEHILEGFHQFEMAIENVNSRLINISKCHSVAECKIKTLNGDWFENIPDITVKFKQYKENVIRRLSEVNIGSIEDVPVIPKYQIKGNPLEDISKQMEENTEKIRRLNEENDKLNIIISRFKRIRK